MKKIVCVLLTLLLLICTTACADNKISNTGKTEYKIAVITKPLSEDRETFENAQQLQKKHGESIVSLTFPHNYATHPEQIVSTMTALADDPDVRVIIIPDVVDGTTVGIQKLRETRNDILIISGMNTENAAEIAPFSDLCLIEDKTATGTTIIEQAVAMKAKTFVYITCQSDLTNSAISAHEELLKEASSSAGISFVEAIAPDSLGAENIRDTQSWINENVPLYVDECGKNTAFYATNEAMSIPLIRQVAACGAILPQLCNPSPYHGYPEAFDIDLAGHEADTSYLLHQIKSVIASYNNEGRMAAWSVSQNAIVLNAGVDYSLQWCNGTVKKRCHRSTMAKSIRSVADNETTVEYYTDEKLGKISHSFAIQDAYYIF
ncbi:MAG: DUF3798 domain-containing protein [Clostridia bacterium]|nr:DUF3798 domain-containing protein [Clostridia bacterium]